MRPNTRIPEIARHLHFAEKYAGYSTITKLTPPAFPSSPSANHHDLPSFLAYAQRTSLDPTSTTYLGTHYEYTVSQILRRLRMTLVRVGGKDDFGIDLIGTWAPPSAPAPLKVLVQCKALAKKASPALVRELEGAFVGAPSGWRGEKGVLGFLVAKKECTKGVRDALGRSLCPLGYVACDDNGRVKQMLWNRRAEEGGLLGLGVELKHFGKEDEKEIVLTWKDHVYG